MCGIAGWISDGINLYEKVSVLERMSETLSKRGPDEKGIFLESNAAMIHRRLAVVDPEHGKQPMTAEYQGEKFVLVYNGELYNTDEVKSQLLCEGFSFESHSDTEVVLKAYICWRERCVEKLSGIFAFSVYESHRKRLFICRDRIGVKPLFYANVNSQFVFGSQIKTILASQVVSAVVGTQGLYELFFLGPARTSGIGVFKHIEELLPGEYVIYENGILKKTRYFTLKAREHRETEAETLEHTRFLIEDSIKRQLVSDVPLCCFLSGGLDSSIITQTASDFLRETKNERLHTYSVEYTDNDKYFERSLFQPNSDTEYIHLMTQNTQSIHHQIVLDNLKLASSLKDATLARDLPGMADVDSSLLLFCKEVKKDFTVALSGECADEIFGGYPWYHNEDILWKDAFPWSADTKIRRKIIKDGLLPFAEEYTRERYNQTIKNTDYLESDTKLDRRMREMFSLNFYWFMQCLLDRKDRMSMDCGLEVRVPFCDYRIVEYAYNIPWKLKAMDSREKGLVRKAFEGILPYEICYRKKSPYPKTHNPLYFKAVCENVKSIMNKKTPLWELLDVKSITDIMENPDTITSPWYGQLMKAPQILAYIIQLDAWFDVFGVNIE